MIFNIFIGIYKFFTMLLSLIKVDLVLNLLYLATAVYFSYNYGTISAFIIIDIVFLLMIFGVAIYALYCVMHRYEKGFYRYSICRVIVELIKVFKALLILNAVNSNYVFSPEMQKDLGNIKFSVLV